MFYHRVWSLRLLQQNVGAGILNYTSLLRSLSKCAADDPRRLCSRHPCCRIKGARATPQHTAFQRGRDRFVDPGSADPTKFVVYNWSPNVFPLQVSVGTLSAS